MKVRLLLVGILILTCIAYVIFKLNEPAFIQKLTPFFPSKDENTPGYYSDLVAFLFTEGFWLMVLVIVTVYFSFYGNLEKHINKIEAILLKNSSVTLYILLMVFFLITILVATIGLKQFPNSADEFAYLFQAEQLSDGKLWDAVHPKPDFFEFHHLAQKDGKWVSRFPPGWPLVLSVAFIFEIPPFAINALIGVIVLGIFYKLMDRFYGERIAIWSVFILAFSSFFIFNAASYFSHTVSLLEGLLFIYFSHRYLQTKRLWYTLLAGFALGMLVMTRQLTAVVFFVPLCAYLLYQLRIRALPPLFLIGLGALPFVGAFLWYNQKITGDPLMPVTVWTNADEALGFVKGHTPVKGLKFTFKRLMMFLYYTSPALLVLYFLYLFERLKNFKRILSNPGDYLFLLLIIGYFFYYHSGGNQYGPRFYLEGFPFLIGFVVARVLRMNTRWAKVFLFCGLIYSIVKIPLITYREHQVIEERMDVYSLVEEQGINNAVVFISSETGIIRPMPVEDLNRNDRHYENDVIYARDLGAENLTLMKHYSTKDFYIYKRGIDVPSGELIKISPEAPSGG
jgi:hypothetical protein